MKKAWVLSYPLSAQRRLWSDWADAQADLSLRWAHTHFFFFFFHVVAHLNPLINFLQTVLRRWFWCCSIFVRFCGDILVSYGFIINFYLHSCVFREFDWLAGYIHFVMKQNMPAVLVLQNIFSCLRDLVFMFSTFFQQFAIRNLFHRNCVKALCCLTLACILRQCARRLSHSYLHETTKISFKFLSNHENNIVWVL